MIVTRAYVIERTWLKMTSVVVVQVMTELRSDVTQVRNTHQKGVVVVDWMTAGVPVALIRGERAGVFFHRIIAAAADDDDDLF